MTVHDLNDMQRYLVEEEAEKWRDGELTRREFMRRVSLLVGAAASTGVLISLGCDPNTPDTTPAATMGAGAATALASPPAASEPSPTAGAAASTTTGQTGGSPYSVPEDSPDVKVEQVDIPTPEGVTLKGYLAMPAVARMNPGAGPGAGPANNAGILVIHENRGLTPYIKDVVRRLGKEGYVAMCVDLISREGGTDAHPDEAERTGILGGMPREQVLADLSAGLDYLKSRPDVAPERLGVVGFCFGGGYSWRMATVRPDLKAAVPYYGPNPPLEDVPKIKAATLGIYGERDTRITSSVPALEEALKATNITHKIIIYPDADHAFHNDTGPRYKEAAATDAWQQTLAWFRQYV
jgi:carboxymethylenebutenolidase